MVVSVCVTMNNNLLFYAILLALVLVTFEQLSFVAAGFGTSVNLTEFRTHRQKRGLIFTNGGTIKVKKKIRKKIPAK